MRASQKILATVLLVLLVAVAYGLWATHSTAARPKSTRAPALQADTLPAVDQTDLLTAQKLAQDATFTEEKEIAQQVVVAADHELDIAFAAALERIEAHPPVLSPAAQKIEIRLNASQKLLEADQASVAQLTAALASASPSQRSSLQDQLNLTQSQLELDQDEVQEANQELAESGGNVHQRIQAMMEQHAATEQKAAPVAAVVDPLANLHGLARRVHHLSSMRDRRRSVDEARERIVQSLTTLAQERQSLVAQLEASKGSVPELAKHTRRARGGEASETVGAGPAATAVSPAAAAGTTPPAPAATPAPAAAATGAVHAKGAAPPAGSTQATATQAAATQATTTQAATTQAATTQAAPGAPGSLLATTRQIAADQKVLTLLDQRITNRRDLVEQYGKWSTLLGTRMGTLLHSALIDVAIVIGILLALVFLDRWLESLLGRTRLDRRQVATLRTVTRVALQIVGIAAILLVLIGLPGQVGTFLGIVGAGLTVALKDFIVAFIGWLVLMGKNGMRLGDWVEINGVSGEVVDLGMFHTVLLETGNWTEAGHPTGRRVTFTNSFAIQGHYFNFSTSGQWLWDEVLVLVPYERDPHLVADAIHKEVLAATAESSHEAEREWRRAMKSQREASFSAAPGIIIRPAAGGVEVAVRYVTRASERFKLRTRLYQTAVQMLAGRSASSAPERLQATTPS
jgi:small-conductance mechanosensitive channel